MTTLKYIINIILLHILIKNSITLYDNICNRAILSIIGSIAEFERSLIRERQREGIELAKKKGKYKGRKPALTEEQILQLQEQIAQGTKKVEVAKHFGISYPTLCKYLQSGSA